MSIHNLWSRKGRTALNLAGVVISCVMLTMTLAGTRGAREGVFDIMNASDQTKKFLIIDSWDRNVKVPAEAIQVPTGVSSHRRQRIAKNLEKTWRSKNTRRIQLTRDRMAELQAIKPITSVVWQNPVRGTFVWPANAPTEESNKPQTPKRTPGSLIGIEPTESKFSSRLVEGKMVSEHDAQGVMLDEYTAYNLGHQTDSELEDLIGIEVQIRVSLSRGTTSPLGGLLTGINDLLDFKTIQSLQRVTDQLEKTDLTDDEKSKIRNTMKVLRLEAAPAEQPTASKNSAAKDFPDDVQVDMDGNKTLVRTGIVRGILKQPEDDEMFGFLQFTGPDRRANLYVHHNVSEQIYARKEGFRGYGSVAASVANVSDLREAIDQVEAIGFRTRSAIQFVNKLESEVGKNTFGHWSFSIVDFVGRRDRNLQHHGHRRT